MKQAIIRNLLLSIRASADAALSMLAEKPPRPPDQGTPPPEECSHPKEWRQELQTMGKKGWFCKCGHVEEVS